MIDAMAAHAMYLRGRHPGGLAFCWCAAIIGSFGLWHLPVPIRFFGEHAPRYVSGVELAVVLAGIASAWCLAPRMATWDAQGVREVRRHATAGVLGVLGGSVLVAGFFVQFAYHLPWSVVSRTSFQRSDFPLDEGPTAATQVVAMNVLLIVSVTFIFVGVVGRLVGTVLMLVSYVGLVYLSAEDGLAGALYSTVARGEPAIVAPLTAGFLAVLIWSRAAGAGTLARRWDPRH